MSTLPDALPWPAQRRHVVICTGVSSYDVLSYLSNDLARAFLPCGFTAEVLDLTRLATATELRRLVSEQRTAFVCGYSGYGANLESAGGVNAWEALGLPYVGLMLDSPCYYPARHWGSGPSALFLHGDDGHHEVSVAISPAGAPRGRFRLAVAAESRPLRPLMDRARTIVFASKGGDPVAYRQQLARTLPARALAFVARVTDALTACPQPQRVWDVAAALRTPSEFPADPARDATYHTLVAHADHLARIERATAVARALLTLPVTFVGGAWDHVAAEARGAAFLPGEPLPVVRRRMADAVAVLNVQPGTTHSIHDRLLLGLHAGAVVVTDTNDVIDRLVGRQHLRLWDGDPASVADTVADALRNPAAHQPMVDAAVAHVRRTLPLEQMARQVIGAVAALQTGHPLPAPEPDALTAAA